MRIKIAGLLTFFTALLHLIGGQISLVNPLIRSDLDVQTKTEWLGAWHLITVILFLFAYYLLRNGSSSEEVHRSIVRHIGWINVLFGLVFIGVSTYQTILAPQFILFLPIGLLILWNSSNRLGSWKREME